MKECRKYEELLARYLHGDALLQDRELLEKHLAMCPDCERLYGEVSDVDRLLRDLPGKQVEPPAYLLARIMANLPEERSASAWERWGRWAMGIGALSACALAIAVTLYRGGTPEESRQASAPPPPLAPPPPSLHTPRTSQPRAELPYSIEDALRHLGINPKLEKARHIL